MTGRRLGGVALLWALAASAAVADGRPLGLRHAVEMALERSAAVEADRVELRRREGRVLGLSGRFDPRLKLDLSLAYQELSLIGGARPPEPTGATAELESSGSRTRVAAAATAEPAAPVDGAAAAQVGAGLRADAGLPADQDAFELRLEGRWRRLLGNGLVLAPGAELAVLDEQLVLGATPGISFDLPTLYVALASFDLELPLARGRGREEVSGELAAQRLELAADEAGLRSSAERAALAVVDAYWRAATASRRLVLLERARDLQREVLGLAEGLVAVDQIPRAALWVTRARVAEVESLVAAARAQEVERRVELADAIGLSLTSPDELPRPVDALPEVPEPAPRERSAELGDRLGRALAARADLEELAWRAQAADQRLTTVARASRPRYDLALSLGWQGYAEGGGFADGLLEAVRGETGGPYASFAFEIELPVGNRERRGAEQQASAIAARVRVERRDRERILETRVVGLVDRLDNAAAEVRRREETARHYRDAVEADLRRLSFGDATLVDLVTTEEQLTAAELAALEAREDHARTLAALRFELGELVEVEVEAGELRLGALESGAGGF